MTDDLRQLDALVAERVMNWEHKGSNWRRNGEQWWIEDDDLPRFSADIAAAFAVVDKISGGHFQLRSTGDSWQAAFGTEPTALWQNATTPAEAICRAALAAVGKED